MNAYQPITIRPGESLEQVQRHVEANPAYKDQLVIILTAEQLFIWQGVEHTLAWYLDTRQATAFISTQAPEYASHTAVDESILDEIGFFGFALSNNTLLHHVQRIFPEHWYKVEAENYQCQNAIALSGDTSTLDLAQPIVRDLVNGQLAAVTGPADQDTAMNAGRDAGPDTDAIEYTLLSALPACSRQMLAPVTTALFAQLTLAAELCPAPQVQLAINNSSAEHLGIQLNIGDWFTLFKNRRKQLRQRVKAVYQQLAELSPGADRNRLDELAWKHFGWPQLQHQLRTVVQSQGKALLLTLDSTAAPNYAFRVHSRPINNILESFQRLFFYACSQLRQMGFFMPPLMSNALIKPQLKNTLANNPSLPMLTLTLDYLLRFQHPIGDDHDCNLN
ncbi:hypothetical protein CHH28_02895 [Bacterioplanes sanyensis]|uniref:Uncharacterized protein n=1 Tax=Bacterioplanes sanyensis TaxID=1249553 RepID=A0A222FFY6_9GAMM|nr:hypothetical protein [Bacterioplanes sanyensis]ASP37680.1 hypothetical protein CHH28_02895 [Bacterioplanes sanyensis]